MTPQAVMCASVYMFRVGLGRGTERYNAVLNTEPKSNISPTLSHERVTPLLLLPHTPLLQLPLSIHQSLFSIL